jgi:hypothetical protein
VQVTNALLISLFAAVFVSSVISQDMDGSAEGTLTRADNGDPISNARVAFGRFVGMTDSDGHFAIPSISPGIYEVSISRDGYVVPGRVDLNVTITPIPLMGSLIVGPSQQIRNFHVEMQPTSTISGRVFGPGGFPQPMFNCNFFGLHIRMVGSVWRPCEEVISGLLPTIGENFDYLEVHQGSTTFHATFRVFSTNQFGDVFGQTRHDRLDAKDA